MQVHAALSAALGLALGGLAACSSVQRTEPAPEQRVPSADGVPIAFEERGSGAPTLVFVHGWCGERGFWRATAEALAPT